MMIFFQRIRDAFRRMMQGRTGIDRLGIALIYTVLALNLLSLIPMLRFLSYAALALFFWMIFRMLSRNTAARYKENWWVMSKIDPLTTKARQGAIRFKNRKQYLYFDCPECRAKLKLPRNVGEVTVTCGKCQHKFRKKA